MNDIKNWTGQGMASASASRSATDQDGWRRLVMTTAAQFAPLDWRERESGAFWTQNLLQTIPLVFFLTLPTKLFFSSFFPLDLEPTRSN